MRNALSILLALLIFSGANPVCAEVLQDAGRTLSVGQTIPESLQEMLANQDIKQTQDDNLLLILFTRPEQRLSENLTDDLTLFVSHNDLKKLEILEISENSTEAEQRTWPVVIDQDSGFYEVFGLVALPSAYLLNNRWEIVHYMPGYTPGFLKELQQVLAEYFPSLNDTAANRPENNVDPEIHRRENLARQLYFQRQYNLALTTLEATDSLTTEGWIIKGMVQVELNQLARANTLFLEWVDQPEVRNYALSGLGIIALKEEDAGRALDYFDKIGSFPQEAKINYLRAQSLEMMGNTEKAEEVCPEEERIKFRNQPMTFLP